MEVFQMFLDPITGEYYFAPEWLNEDVYYQYLEERHEDEKYEKEEEIC